MKIIVEFSSMMLSRSKASFHCQRVHQWPFFDLTQLERVHTKASSKIKRSGRSVSQRLMPRETEKPPLTMIDEKYGTMKSENLSRGSVHTLTEPRRRIEEFILLSRWSWSDECSIFISRQSFFPTVFLGFRTHVVATTACTTVGVFTLTCRTHIFLLHSLSAYIHTTLCVSHTRMAQGQQKGSLHMCRFSPSRLLPFLDSPRLLCCFRSLTSRPLPTTTSPTIPST